jgi:hypothetical protein
MGGIAKPAVEANSRQPGMQGQSCHATGQKHRFQAAQQGSTQALALVGRGDGHLAELHLRGGERCSNNAGQQDAITVKQSELLLLSFGLQILLSQVQPQRSTENQLAELEFSLLIRGVELDWTQVHGNAVTLRFSGGTHSERTVRCNRMFDRNQE